MKKRLCLASAAALALALSAALPSARGENSGAQGGAVRPPPPAGEERSAPRPPPPPRLAGVILMADVAKSAALIEACGIRGVGVFRVGDALGEAKVVSISAGEVVLEGKEGRESLRLLPASAAASPTGDTIVFNVDNVELRTVIRFISELTKTNFIVDDRVRGLVTVMTPSPIPASEAMALLGSVLEMRGYAMIQAGAFVKIVPKEEGTRASVPVAGEGRAKGKGATE